jgi:hypothetical protein
MSFWHRPIKLPYALAIIAGWVAVIGIVSLAYSMRSRPPPATGTPVCSFAGPCPSVFKDQQSVAPSKSDKVRVIPIYRDPPPPVSAPVVPPVPAPAPAPKPPIAAATEPELVEPERPIRRHWHDSDICVRHGLHRVETRNGRSWRCR